MGGVRGHQHFSPFSSSGTTRHFSSHLQPGSPPLLQIALRRGCPSKGAWHARCGKDYGILRHSWLLQSRQSSHNHLTLLSCQIKREIITVFCLWLRKRPESKSKSTTDCCRAHFLAPVRGTMKRGSLFLYM